MKATHVATVLHRSVQGLLNAVNKASPEPWALQVRQAKRKMGREVFYVTERIAVLIQDIADGVHDD